MLWLRMVDGVPLTRRDLVGGVLVLLGMAVLMGGRGGAAFGVGRGQGPDL